MLNHDWSKQVIAADATEREAGVISPEHLQTAGQ